MYRGPFLAQRHFVDISVRLSIYWTRCYDKLATFINYTATYDGALILPAYVTLVETRRAWST